MIIPITILDIIREHIQHLMIQRHKAYLSCDDRAQHLLEEKILFWAGIEKFLGRIICRRNGYDS